MHVTMYILFHMYSKVIIVPCLHCTWILHSVCWSWNASLPHVALGRACLLWLYNIYCLKIHRQVTKA